MNGNTDEHSTPLIIYTEERGIVHANSTSNSWMQNISVVVAHVNKGDHVFVKTLGTSL